MSDWRWNSGIARTVVIAWMAVHLAVPIALFVAGDDSSLRFGWQMFSKPAPAYVYTVEKSDGSTFTVTPYDVLARARGDIPISDLIPPHMCRITADAVRVTWDEGSHEC